MCRKSICMCTLSSESMLYFAIFFIRILYFFFFRSILMHTGINFFFRSCKRTNKRFICVWFELWIFAIGFCLFCQFTYVCASDSVFYELIVGQTAWKIGSCMAHQSHASDAWYLTLRREEYEIARPVNWICSWWFNQKFQSLLFSLNAIPKKRINWTFDGIFFFFFAKWNKCSAVDMTVFEPFDLKWNMFPLSLVGSWA